MVQVELRQMLMSAFSEGELITLCTDLQVDYTNLPGITREDKARELIAFHERRGSLPALITYCRHARPNLAWPTLSKNERSNLQNGKNPYSWNTVNLDVFFGRNEILDEMLNHLPGNPRQSFGISGARRIGKTTLLRRVESELKAEIDQWQQGGTQVIPIYVDGLALPRPLSSSDLWKILLKQLQAVIPQMSVVPDYVDFETFKAILKPILSNLQQIPRVIVLFDEIEPIIVCDWSDSFLAHWRALLGNTPELSEYFTAVFSGAREITALRRDIGSPLQDILEYDNLESLEYEAACSLMQEPINRKWPETFLEKAYRETGGHPMLLQYIMQNVYESPLEQAEAALDAAVKKFSKKRRWQFSEWWERYCTVEAQLIYARLPEDSKFISLRSLVQEFGSAVTQDALEILLHNGLIAAEDDGFAYRYSGEMFRRWFRQYGTFTPTSLHDPELYSRLLQLEELLATKYLSAWKIMNTDLPNYSSAVGEIRDVLTHLLDLIAPNDKVVAEQSFGYESGQNRATRRQRVHYAARKLYQNQQKSSEIVSDYDLLEMEAEHLAQITTSAYRVSSGLTHTVASRDNAYRVLKQWENILVQLLPNNGQSPNGA